MSNIIELFLQWKDLKDKLESNAKQGDLNLEEHVDELEEYRKNRAKLLAQYSIPSKNHENDDLNVDI
jgi:hypothetical protein